MGIILSALAAAGDSGVQSLNQNIEQQNRQDLEDQRSALETSKALAIAKATNDMKNKPLNDYVTVLAAHQDDTMPLAPPGPATALTGTPDANAYGSSIPDDHGITGNIANMKAFAMSMDDSNPDKRLLLAQISDQESKQNAATLAAAPTTGPASKAAIIQSAMDDLASSGNGAAYSAGMGFQSSDSKMAYLQSRADNAKERNDVLQQRYDDQRLSAQEHNTVSKQLADSKGALQDAQSQLALSKAEGAASGKGDPGVNLNTAMKNNRDDITALIETRQVTFDKGTGSPSGPGVAQYNRLISRQAVLGDALDKHFNLKTSPDANPPVPGLPAGAVQIGTSGGKAVYQLPDGSKVKAQ